MIVRPFAILTLALTLLLSAGDASAQSQKIGIVDMKRIFQDYYKTRDAEKKVNEDKSKAKQELDVRNAKYRDLITKFNEIDKILKDKLVNEELKMQKQKESQEIVAEARELERTIAEFRQRREKQLQEQVMRMRKGLMEEISARVEEKSKRDNYDFVFDKSGLSTSGVPFLLFSKDAGDITTEILTELNKNAPKESAASAETSTAPAPAAPAPAAGGKGKK